MESSYYKVVDLLLKLIYQSSLACVQSYGLSEISTKKKQILSNFNKIFFLKANIIGTNERNYKCYFLKTNIKLPHFSSKLQTYLVCTNYELSSVKHFTSFFSDVETSSRFDFERIISEKLSSNAEVHYRKIEE